MLCSLSRNCRWSLKEDQLLARYVGLNATVDGEINWNDGQSDFPKCFSCSNYILTDCLCVLANGLIAGKSAEDCRARWRECNESDKQVRRGKWTDEETMVRTV